MHAACLLLQHDDDGARIGEVGGGLKTHSPSHLKKSTSDN